MAWLVRALREAKGSEEGECGGCRRSGSKGRLNDDEQLTLWITELGMAFAQHAAVGGRGGFRSGRAYIFHSHTHSPPHRFPPTVRPPP